MKSNGIVTDLPVHYRILMFTPKSGHLIVRLFLSRFPAFIPLKLFRAKAIQAKTDSIFLISIQQNVIPIQDFKYSIQDF